MAAKIAGVTVGQDKLINNGKGQWKLVVQNTAGYELPHTGGSGMVMFHLSV